MMMRMLGYGMLVLFTLSLPPLQAEALPLAEEGQPLAQIVLPATASDTELYAANELQYWLERISGARLPLVRDLQGDNTKVRLLVGRELAAAFTSDLEACGTSDGYAIRPGKDGRTIHIFGAIPRGTLHGVYAFIEANSDLIWARPDPDLGIVYSSNPNLQAEVVDLLELPRSTLRGWGWTVSGVKHDAHWSSRNRINWLGYYSATNLVMGSQYNPAGGGHGLKLFVKPEQYFEEHPEWYPFRGGKRVPGGQLCFMAYEMLPTYLANLRAALDSRPGSDGVNISITDGWGVCDCPKCLAPLKLADGTVIAPDDPAFRSTQFYLFLNEIARQLQQTHPKVVILTYAYIFTVVPPPLKLESNIRVMYCPFVKDDKFTIFDPVRNPKWRDYTLGWGRAGDKTWLREYYGCAADFPRPLEDVVQQDLQFCLTNGIHEFHSELPVDKLHSHNPDRIWDASAMTMWVISRLWWNPDLNVAELRDYYLQRTFREAAPAMARYFKLIRESWYGSEFPSVYSDAGDNMGRMYVVEAGIEEACRQALDEAANLAQHPVSQKLIERQRQRFDSWVEFAKTDKTVRATVPYLAEAGQLDFAAAAWHKGAGSDDFVHCVGSSKGEPAKIKSSIKLLHDVKNLYIKTVAYAPDMSTLQGTAKFKDGQETFPRGDHFELFLADSRTGVYYHFAYDLGNEAVYDAKGYDQRWETTWQRRYQRHDDRWETIVTIPLEAIGFNITENNKLRFLVYRSKYYQDGSTNKQGQPVTVREQSSWGAGFVHQVASFCELTLEQK